MSNLQKLILNAKAGLSIQEQIPDQKWQEIAASCGPAEMSEIKLRIDNLRKELESVDEWDGDTQDDINLAIYKFNLLLEAAEAHHAKLPS